MRMFGWRVFSIQSKSSSDIDWPALQRLLEIRIVAVSIVSGFVLSSLSSNLSNPQGGVVNLGYLPGSYPLPEAIVIHSALTLLLLTTYAIVDLSAIHFIAFKNYTWAMRAYVFNIAYAVFPFMYGAGEVVIMRATPYIPILLASELSLRFDNSVSLILLVCLVIVLYIIFSRRFRISLAS